MSFDPLRIVSACGPGTVEEAHGCLVAADWFLSVGDRALAASALDRAYGILPHDAGVARQRRAVLDELAVVEHGLVFRYVPTGTFLMGSPDGDPDERPVHAQRVRGFWMTDVPITWAAYCRLLGWSPPPDGAPPASDPSIAASNADDDFNPVFIFREQRKIRLQYCESETTAAHDWHYHFEQKLTAFDTKPMIAVSALDAEELAAVLSHGDVRYRLPTEAEWEKAARGGLIGCRWSWGDEPPTPERCDFDRFGAFHLTDPRSYPANGYGLHSMCGGVAEWTADLYDALAYDPRQPKLPVAHEARAVRGGSWADCAEAVTVSFRGSRVQASWRNMRGYDWGAPNVGFRLVRN